MEGITISVDKIHDSYGVIREQRITDGVIPDTAAEVNDYVAAMFLSSDSYITYDLGIMTTVTGIELVSLDNHIHIALSRDGTHYSSYGVERKRSYGKWTILIGNEQKDSVRYIKLSVADNITMSAVSECAVRTGPSSQQISNLDVRQPATFQDAVDSILRLHTTIYSVKFIVALLIIPCLYFVRLQSQVKKIILSILLAAIGFLCWLNFGWFHGDGGFIHQWEFAHYYLGAKYFDELGYSDLYNSISEHERIHGRGQMVDASSFRDLNTYALFPGTMSRSEGWSSTTHFSMDRWTDFQMDVDNIRRQFDLRHFYKILEDHGYNATPLLTTILGTAATISDSTDSSLFMLAMVDVLLLLIAIALLWRAFGPSTGAAAMLFIGLGSIWGFSWTGGAFGRYLWFACACAGLASLRRQSPFLGGFWLALSGMLRLFPLALMSGFILQFITRIIAKKRTVHHKRLIAGIGTVIILGFAIPVLVYGADVYGNFLNNSRLHASVSPGNHLGLGALLSAGLDGSILSASDIHNTASDTLLLRRLLWVTGVALALFVLWKAVRSGFDSWELVSLSTLIIYTAIPLSGYDYIWMALLLPFASKNLYRLSLIFGFVAVTNASLLLYEELASQYLLINIGLLLVLILFSIDILRTPSRISTPHIQLRRYD